ncbi:hypothetical protein BB561_003275 [Smittium simulii]|uniref:G domain-containing protein n=1 Tax=Smittium simulii TaxID=133385 RepID=A0A2T9YME3_9FUNG|nr:hypothetical protein BB561_003275 [Smittium simulii]
MNIVRLPLCSTRRLFPIGISYFTQLGSYKTLTKATTNEKKSHSNNLDNENIQVNSLPPRKTLKNLREKRKYEFALENILYNEMSHAEQVSHMNAINYFREGDSKFISSVVKFDPLSELKAPAVAFNGRSNVGKSSLINAVLDSDNLVKTSGKPGHTRTLNFFKITGKYKVERDLQFVDMPGIQTSIKTNICKCYKSRLKKIYLLIDTNVGELKKTDIAFLQVTEDYNVPVQIVLTKADKRHITLEKIKQNVLDQALEITPKNMLGEVLSTSSKSIHGINQLRLDILKTCFK